MAFRLPLSVPKLPEEIFESAKTLFLSFSLFSVLAKVAPQILHLAAALSDARSFSNAARVAERISAAVIVGNDGDWFRTRGAILLAI